MPVTGHTRVAGVIGDPVRHSLSPLLHNAAFAALGVDWVYLAFEVPRGSAVAAVDGMRALGLAGLSVTMPHKEAVVPALDHLTPVAAALGSVNTISAVGDGLLGDSTDGAGLLDALLVDHAFDPAGKRCLVLGSGGAARAVVHALAGAGASDVLVVGRTTTKVEAVAALAPGIARSADVREAADVDLVVNATPLGMRADDPPPLATSLLGAGQLVVDLVYHPPVTALVTEARGRGAVASNGLGMLVHQAARAFRAWTGEEPPVAAMSAAALAELTRQSDGRAGPSADQSRI